MARRGAAGAGSRAGRADEEGESLLLEAYDVADGALARWVLAVLVRSPAPAARGAWLDRLERSLDANRAADLARTMLTWQDEELERALGALVSAPHLEPARRVELVEILAHGARAEVALALVTPFWTTRGDPANAIHLGAARACLRNPAIPRERLREVVEPIALELLTRGDQADRRAALEMLSTPALASELTLDTLIQLRRELAQAGLRGETRTAVRALLRHTRRQRREGGR